MAASASNMASARVSAMLVRVLVAWRKTTHFQQHGFVTSKISNWMPLYSMAVPRGAGIGRRVSSTAAPNRRSQRLHPLQVHNHGKGHESRQQVRHGLAFCVRHLAHRKQLSKKHIESTLRYLQQLD